MRLNANPKGQQAEELEQYLRNMLKTQLFAVLSTVGGDQPYASLVAFATSNDLSRIYFTTSRMTRKFSNLEGNPKSSMLIDNRSNQIGDLRKAAAATALGKVKELSFDQEENFQNIFLKKHSHFADFISSPNTAKICLLVDRYYVVSRFQNVFEFKVKP